MAQPFAAFRTVKVEILDGMKGFDGGPVTPWTISFLLVAERRLLDVCA
jgi:hypothetical protein